MPTPPALFAQLELLEPLLLKDPAETKRQLLPLLETARAEHDRRAEAYALCLLGGTAFFQGNYPDTMLFADYGLKVSRATGDEALEARCLNALGIASDRMGRYDDCLRYYTEGLKLATERGDEVGRCRLLVNIASVYGALEDHERALSLYHEAAALATTLNHTHYRADALRGVIEAMRQLDRPDEALELLPGVMDIAQAGGFKRLVTSLHYIGGQLLLAERQLAEALRWAQRGLKLAEDAGDQEDITTMHWLLGECYLNLAEYDKALIELRLSDQLAREIRYPQIESDAKRSLSKVHEIRGDYRLALAYLKEHLEIERVIRAKDIARRAQALSGQVQAELTRRKDLDAT